MSKVTLVHTRFQPQFISNPQLLECSYCEYKVHIDVIFKIYVQLSDEKHIVDS